VVQQGPTTTVIPRRLLVVLLGSHDRFGEGAALLNRGWSLHEGWAAAGRPVDSKSVLGGPNQ
jgi:hypothetical protein